MASKKRNFYYSGPSYLTAVDWTNLQHRRIVAASLVQGTYCMQHDRRHNLQAVAPLWWESFNFKPVKELYDVRDNSIFGAIFEFKFTTSCVNYLHQNPPRFTTSCVNYLHQNPPRYVVAFRGTIFKKCTWKQDLKLDFQLMRNELPQSTRVQLAMQAVQNIVSKARDENIWLVGHSLGSAIALEVGKNMVKKEGCFIETYLFNPPFTSVPIELLKIENLKHEFRCITSVTKAAVAVALLSQHQRSQIDHSFNVLSSWSPYLFVNPSDPICSEYIGYFEHREKMVEVGVGNIARLATQNSLGNLILGATRKDSEPPHLIPSAYLTINVSPTQDLKQAHGIHQWWCKFKQWWCKFKQAHGIHQWWEQNINCQVNLHKYRTSMCWEMSWYQRYEYVLEGSEEMSWYDPHGPQFTHLSHNAMSLHEDGYAEGTSNPNNRILAIQGANGQMDTFGRAGQNFSRIS